MSDERPSLSPYNYCQWNPVMLVDPDGLLDQETENAGNGPGNPTSQPKPPKVQPSKVPTQLPSGTPNAPSSVDNVLVIPGETGTINQGLKPEITPPLGHASTIAEVTGLITKKEGMLNLGKALAAGELIYNTVNGDYLEAAKNLVETQMGPVFTAGELFVAASETKVVLNRTGVVTMQNRAYAARMYNLSGKSKVWERQLTNAIMTERTVAAKLTAKR